MENQNSQYNRDVAEVFIALAKAYRGDVTLLVSSEIKILAEAARELSANKPQVY